MQKVRDKLVIGIDYGSRHCGLAIKPKGQDVVVPDRTVDTQDLKDRIGLHSPELIVLGLPTGVDGQETEQTREVIGFYQRLKQELPSVDIVFQDEFATSIDAKKLLTKREQKLPILKQKDLLHSYSATLILRDYLISLREQGLA
ncbi:Holliday junction resolvase RuvX [Candidatus Saccharibacteria bacterium]|nr:Holliday junction resolvase RuvX [Candidatus Saccharibacteria bacterium]